MGFCYGKRLIKEWIPATTPLSEILCSLVDLTDVGCGSLLLIHVIVVFPPAVSVLCNVDLLPIQVAKVVSKGWGIGRNGDSPNTHPIVHYLSRALHSYTPKDSRRQTLMHSKKWLSDSFDSKIYSMLSSESFWKVNLR